MSFIVICEDCQTSQLTYFGPFENRSDAIECAKKFCTVKSRGKGECELSFNEEAGTFSATQIIRGWVKNSYANFKARIQTLVHPETLEEEIKRQEEAAKTVKQEEKKPEEQPKQEEGQKEATVDPAETVLASTTQEVVNASI